MTDLAEQLRAKIAEMRHNAQKRGIDADEEHDERLYRLSADAEAATGALLAVLELHKPVKGSTLHCGECFYPDTTAQLWPCDTVEAVVKALGIEATGE